MCGRFAFYSPHEAVARLFGVAAAPEVEPRYNIAPMQFVATVRDAGGSRGVAMLYWGLVLADGYYEWRRSGAIKQPSFISFAAPGLQARPVSRRVNDARNQGAGLLEWLGTADDAP